MNEFLFMPIKMVFDILSCGFFKIFLKPSEKFFVDKTLQGYFMSLLIINFLRNAFKEFWLDERFFKNLNLEKKPEGLLLKKYFW